jgi:hypothetical protein
MGPAAGTIIPSCELSSGFTLIGSCHCVRLVLWDECLATAHFLPRAAPDAGQITTRGSVCMSRWTQMRRDLTLE